MSEKRGPGRPRGTSPHGLPPGSDGAPTLRIRMAPEDLERVRNAGGSTWAREVILAALRAREGAEGNGGIMFTLNFSANDLGEVTTGAVWGPGGPVPVPLHLETARLAATRWGGTAIAAAQAWAEQWPGAVAEGDDFRASVTGPAWPVYR